MGEIQWLEPRREVSKGNVPENAEVRVFTSMVKNGTEPITYLTFYNFAEKKIAKTDRLMIGLGDSAIYLKEPEGIQKGRKVVRNKKNGENSAAVVHISKFNAKEVFKNHEGMQGYFKLQHSVTNDCWFIALSGKVG